MGKRLVCATCENASGNFNTAKTPGLRIALPTYEEEHKLKVPVQLGRAVETTVAKAAAAIVQ